MRGSESDSAETQLRVLYLSVESERENLNPRARERFKRSLERDREEVRWKQRDRE